MIPSARGIDVTMGLCCSSLLAVVTASIVLISFGFPTGLILRGKDVTDQMVHQFQTLRRKDGRVIIEGDPARIVKRTLEIETK